MIQKKKTMNSISKLLNYEALLKKEGPLYIQSDRHSITNIQEFIEVFFGRLNYSYCTYYDKEFRVQQCMYSKRRSLGDIYRIGLSFLPELSLVDLTISLTSYIEGHKPVIYHYTGIRSNKFISTFICPDISKRVYFINNYAGNSTFTNDNIIYGMAKGTPDEIGLLPEDYKSLNKEYNESISLEVEGGGETVQV